MAVQSAALISSFTEVDKWTLLWKKTPSNLLFCMLQPCCNWALLAVSFSGTTGPEQCGVLKGTIHVSYELWVILWLWLSPYCPCIRPTHYLLIFIVPGLTAHFLSLPSSLSFQLFVLHVAFHGVICFLSITTQLWFDDYFTPVVHGFPQRILNSMSWNAVQNPSVLGKPAFWKSWRRKLSSMYL